MGEGNENLVYPFSWDFKRLLMCRKILRHGTSGFIFVRRKVCCGFLSPLKKSIALAGFEPANFGSNDKHSNHYTTKATTPPDCRRMFVTFLTRTVQMQIMRTSLLIARNVICLCNQSTAVPWLRSLVAGLSPRRAGFAPGSIHVGFVVDKVALGQVFLPVLRFSPVNI
jgi:hypothetical protein